MERIEQEQPRELWEVTTGKVTAMSRTAPLALEDLGGNAGR
ncbi:hypothetical protein [Leptolyngbya sp. FACHB-711]|nr:hypothetical protein [Leptolyngbya sp. FACHB-711]